MFKVLFVFTQNLANPRRDISKSPLRRQRIGYQLAPTQNINNVPLSPMKLMRKPDVSKSPMKLRPNRSNIAH